jgi:voltage-gated potassium channel
MSTLFHPSASEAGGGRPTRLLVAFSTLLGLVVFGTLGYHLTEHWSLFDSLYMTVTTITTIGYREVHPLSAAGRVFTMFLVLTGVTMFFYAGSEIFGAIIGGELRRLLGRQRMEHALEKISAHIVVCGYGRMGRLVCKEFSAAGIPVVVIERQAELLEDFDVPHAIPIHGDGASDEILERAGVRRARGLVAVVASDADNLFITMSARLLNEQMFIVARADEEGAQSKLLRGGANRVISPYVIGGQRVAQAVLRPAVVDFLELATRTEHLELQIEESQVSAGSALAGRTLKDSEVRQKLEIIILAIKRPSGRMLFAPSPDTLLEPGDTLITVGSRQQLDQLERLATRARA